jgi:phospholipase C
MPFRFDRLGVRVPAVLVSPWVQKGTVIPGVSDPNPRVFEHASIPATITDFFVDPQYAERSPREKAAERFLDIVSLDVMRTDTPVFVLG